MKVNTLRLKKAMSAALFVLLLSMVGMKNALAQNQVATLQHNDTISAFYGINAFSSACYAASAGDIITLSSGTFNGATITKSITVRGAGCANDTILGSIPTIIAGNCTFGSTTSGALITLTIEGVCFNGTITCGLLCPKFTRCNFTSSIGVSGGNGYNSGGIIAGQFVNCRFANLPLVNYSNYSSNNSTLINCVVGSLLSSQMNYSVNAYNTIIGMSGGYSNMFAYNCIFIRKAQSTNYQLMNNSTAQNCIGIKIVGQQTDIFPSSIISINCMEVTSYEDVFESFDGEFSMDEQFVLTEEIANGFLGYDGTEVGIHGGAVPFQTRPMYLVPVHCNVANKSTIDGKLSVDIEVITEGD